MRTGSLRIAATFPNPDHVLRPGQFARVRVLSEVKENALLIPQRAVTELQGMYQIAVVGADNTASIRPVKVGERIGSMWIIENGLKPGERVVVEGIQKVRDGVPVVPNRGRPRHQKRNPPRSRQPVICAWRSFFINRPIVAIVIAILMTIIGAVA